MRIIAGSRKGHRIAAPKGGGTRPTGDRVREALFSMLGPIEGVTVLDLFAGSGALGLEALSRGASHCVFVESDRGVAAVIRANLDKLRLTEADVVTRDALEFLGEATREPAYDLVLCDPPYDAWSELEPRLSRALPGVLAPGGIVAVETSEMVEPQLDLDLVTSRRYGSARITLFTR
jgi:16S rRNA (guanine966-N2)-methyltransferase